MKTTTTQLKKAEKIKKSITTYDFFSDKEFVVGKMFTSNMAIVYKSKEVKTKEHHRGNRHEYKCGFLGRSINEEGRGIKEGNGPKLVSRKVEANEYLTLVFDNKNNHDLTDKNLGIITDFSVLGNDYRNDKGETQTLKYGRVVEGSKVAIPSSSKLVNPTMVRVRRDKERELEVFGTVDRIESDISNTELLGILKDRILKKEIDALCGPGRYGKEEYDKSVMYPASVRFGIGDTKETDFTIYISEYGIFDADNKDVEKHKDTKLADATKQQILAELEKRK